MGNVRIRTSVEAWAVGFLATLSVSGCGGNSEPESTRHSPRVSADDTADDPDEKQEMDAGDGKTVTEGPATEGPVAEGPATEGPVAEGPVAEDPVAEGTGGTANTPATELERNGAGNLLCRDPHPLPDFNGDDTYLVECAGGMLHRPTTGECPSKLPYQQPASDPVDGGVGGANPFAHPCEDTKCNEEPHGHCAPGDESGAEFCRYGCVRDEECGEGAVCVCDDPVGRCVSAACVTNDDCGSDSLCAATFHWDCSYQVFVTGFTCLAPEDACGGSGDCDHIAASEFSGEAAACVVDYLGSVRACGVPSFICGRPFLIAGEARLASVEPRAFGDELKPLAPRDAYLRRALAEHWARMGAMEHASIAAFARFSLQLLGLGAPAELLSQCHRAMRDELHHAKLCFGLASAYGGEALGPGRLPIDGALATTELCSVLELVVLEGCLGETFASVEALEAAAHARDPEVRRILFRIAKDEERHATLAWQTLSWALSRYGSSARVRATVERAFADGLAQLEGARSSYRDVDERALLAHGVLSDALRDEVRRQAAERAVLVAYERLPLVSPRAA